MHYKKNTVKKTVDACMTILLLCLMAYQVTGEALHEWIGIGMTFLVIVHQILNIRWYRAMFKGKYNSYRTGVTLVNGLLIVSFLVTAFCGMAIINFLFFNKTLNIGHFFWLSHYVR